MADRVPHKYTALLAACLLAPVALAQDRQDPTAARYLIPGPAPSEAAPRPVNPYRDDPDAIQEGRRLFDWYNCSGCHAAQGAGGMGPPLSDDAWIYGGDPASLFNTIWEGRPAGMPVWSGMIPPDEIWKIITYIENLPVENPAWAR